jgi:NAD(P)-dependent dehydrogenase (short-subunit alcohol dehydrogenase family)
VSGQKGNRRRIVVTGASSGIGLALTEQLITEGIEVIAIDRNPCPIQEVIYLQLDLANYWDVRSQLEAIPGPIMGLANVAGVSGMSDAATVIAANFLGPKALAEELLLKMTTDSAIANVASISAGTGALPDAAFAKMENLKNKQELQAFITHYAVSGDQAYRISKKATAEWSRTLAARLVPRRIRVNCVSPGPIATPLLEQFRTSMGKSAIDRASKILGRHGTPEETAKVIRFLLSPQSSWVNGINIPVDGGLLAHRETSRNEQQHLRAARHASRLTGRE